MHIVCEINIKPGCNGPPALIESNENLIKLSLDLIILMS